MKDARQPLLTKPIRSLQLKLEAAERARDAAASRATQAEAKVRDFARSLQNLHSRAEKAEADLARIRELVRTLSRAVEPTGHRRKRE